MTPGVDAVKVGIGGGSICTTRVVAASAWPMISSNRGLRPRRRRAQTCRSSPDGGIRYCGDIVKASPSARAAR